MTARPAPALAVSLPAKALVLRAQTELFIDKDLTAFDRYWAEPYLQHNPLLPDGVVAVRAFMTRILPVSDMTIVRALGDDDMVVLHQRVTLPGVIMAVFDVYRVADDRLVEHWDAIQPDEGSPEPGRTLFDGPAEPGDADTTVTRSRVAHFVDAVLVGGAMDRAADHVAPGLVRHGVGLRDGLAAFRAELDALHAAGDAYVACERVLAEGDWALSACTASIGGVPWTIYDLWRVAGDRIVEQWRVAQAVPDPATSALPEF